MRDGRRTYRASSKHSRLGKKGTSTTNVNRRRAKIKTVRGIPPTEISSSTLYLAPPHLPSKPRATGRLFTRRLGGGRKHRAPSPCAPISRVYVSDRLCDPSVAGCLSSSIVDQRWLARQSLLPELNGVRLPISSRSITESSIDEPGPRRVRGSSDHDNVCDPRRAPVWWRRQQGCRHAAVCLRGRYREYTAPIRDCVNGTQRSRLSPQSKTSRGGRIAAPCTRARHRASGGVTALLYTAA